MTMSRPTAALAFAACLLAVPALGQQSARTYLDEQSGLRLDDAIARAIAQEPLTRAVRAEVEVSRGRLQQAGLRPNPTFSFDHRTEPGGTDNLTTAGVEWPLDLFRRSARVDASQRELDAAGFAVSERERILAGEVRMQYGVAAAAVRELAIAADTVAAVERQFGLVRARVETGSTPPLERDLINVELSRLQAIQRMAVGRTESTLVRLKQLLGMSANEPLVLGQSIETLVTAVVANAPPALPLSETRSDVRAAEALVAVADSKIDQARNEGRFDLSLYGSYMRMDAGFPQLGFNAAGSLERIRGRFNYFTVGGMLVVPLLNRNQGQVAAAQAERTAAESRRDAALLAARAEVASATARDQQARQAVDLFAGSIRALARKNLDVIRETYELGRATIFDVLAEQRRYLEIERDYTDALREAWEARATLKAALGEIK
ncbi:MAG TPA: TolC family protein [Vicinamibacterales bacterium]|nr:TolC family protein [Vicinamibacterales bacterium]